MDDGADASREYERLRAELADFVLDALAERIAAGDEPQLSKALIEAIDRRVDAAVEDRLARSEWPDPAGFADAVLDAAAGRAGSGDRLASTVARTRAGESKSKSAPSRRPAAKRAGMTPLQLGLIALIGILVVAGLTFFLLRGTGTAPPPAPNNAADPLIIEEKGLPPANTMVPSAAGGGGGNGVADVAGGNR